MYVIISIIFTNQNNISQIEFTYYRYYNIIIEGMLLFLLFPISHESNHLLSIL